MRRDALRGAVRLLGLGSRAEDEVLKACGELLRGAKQPGEKKLILAVLANVNDPDAIKVVEPLLRDNQVKAEAELAMLGIAKAVAGSAPDRAKSAAKVLLEKSTRQNVQKEAAGIINLIDKSADYVMAWQVSGPYRKRGQDFDALFDAVFAPEDADAKGVSWRVLSPDAKSSRPWMFNLGKAVGGQNRAAYVRTWVHSEDARQVRVEFGTDDGDKLWVNGKLVHGSRVGGAAAPGEHKVDVKLNKGWNALLLKVTQDTGQWEFCLRIRESDGDEIDGLRVQAAPPVK